MTLDEIRRNLVSLYDRALIASRVADQDCAIYKAKIEAHDCAVATMGSGAAKPERAKRRDIAALVRNVLTELRAATVSEVAEKTGVPPSRVLPALKKVGRLVPGGDTHWERGP